MGCGASAPVETPEPRVVVVHEQLQDNVVGLAVGATVTNRPMDHISYCAVSLEWLVTTFLEWYPEVVDTAMSAREMVRDVIKPETAEIKDSYVELLRQKDPDAVDIISRGRRFFYVSFTWGRPFIETLAMLREHFSSHRQAVWRRGKKELPWSSVYVWLDVLACDQHHPMNNEVSTFLVTLREMVQDAEQTLLVMDKDGDVLDRVTFFYDAWGSAPGGPAKSKPHNRLALLSYGLDSMAVDKALAQVESYGSDLEGSERDPDRIHADIHDTQRSLGMSDEWRTALATSRQRQLPDEQAASELLEGLDRAALTCQLYGHYDQAEPLYRRALDIRENLYGREHPDTLTTVVLLASLLKKVGRPKSAEPLYDRSFHVVEPRVVHADTEDVGVQANLRPSPPPSEPETHHTRGMPNAEASQRMHSTAGTDLDDLAAWLRDQGVPGVAVGTDAKGMDTRGTDTMGDDPTGMAQVVKKLHTLLRAQTELDEAEQLFKTALQKNHSKMDPHNRHSMATIHKLARLLQQQRVQFKEKPHSKCAACPTKTTRRRDTNDGDQKTPWVI